MPRLTKPVRQRILEQNEGFTTSTHNKQRNFREDRTYTISDGALHIRAQGKTSWADSHYDREWIADDEETHRFLRNHKRVLNLDGIADERDTTENRKKEIRQATSIAEQETNKLEDEGLAIESDSYFNEDAGITDDNDDALAEAVGAILIAVSVYGASKAAPYINHWWHDKAVPSLKKMKSRITGKAEKTEEEAELKAS
jgi:hypothetical protein